MMKSFLFSFILLVLLLPVSVQAKEAKTHIFSVELEVQNHCSIAPNDYFTETFIIKNLTSTEQEIRISKVSNLENSKLYPVILAGLIDEQKSIVLNPLDQLTLNWLVLKPKETVSLPIQLYFPAECGNEYQNSDLKALITFECRVNEEGISKETPAISISQKKSDFSPPAIPATRDSAKLISLSSMLAFSSGILFLLRSYHKRKKEAFK
jgi:hypothetical protein